jgi:hypothetical protein
LCRSHFFSLTVPLTVRPQAAEAAEETQRLHAALAEALADTQAAELAAAVLNEDTATLRIQVGPACEFQSPFLIPVEF